MLKNFNIQNDSLAAYYLNDTERRITGALKKHPNGLTIKELTARTKKTRLTLLHSLNKLLLRGFVSKDEKKKAHVWKFVETNNCLSSVVQETTLDEAYSLLSRHPSKKIYSIQGTEAISYEIKSWLDPNKNRTIKKAHVSQKLKTTVLDGIIGEEALPLLAQLPQDIRRSHFGRATIGRVLPKGTFDSPCELFFTGDLVCVLLPKDDYALMIKSKHLANMLFTLYSLVTVQTKRINVGEVYKD